IILLKTRNCGTNLWRKDAVNRTAIIAEPAQCGLHFADITRLHNQLLRSLKIIIKTPTISWCEVGGGHRTPLMQQSPFVSLRQRIDGTKTIIVPCLRCGCTESKNESESHPFHKITFTTYLSPQEERAAVSVTICRSPASGNPGNRPDRARVQNASCLPIFGAADKDRASSASPLDASE